ncbi:MAG: VWA domain-containing protein [Pseudomonadota bacterium]
MIEQFHFLRPAVLLLLLPLALGLWWWSRSRLDQAIWRSIVDKQLMPFVLSDEANTSQKWLFRIAAISVFLALVALAGPTWEKRLQPVYRDQSALVIALDLSRSMDAADIRPSRLVRARHKISDILARQATGQTALIVYAADAFSVTPLTDDIDTILAMLPDLETRIMPAQGTRADRAFRLALELFRNSGVSGGDFLLVSDALSSEGSDRLTRLVKLSPQVRFSVLATGTEEGGPVPLHNGGFLKDKKGSVVISKLQAEPLQKVAALGGGVYAELAAGDGDVNALTDLISTSIRIEGFEETDGQADRWRELGPALLVMILPFVAIAFRRGYVWLLPFCVMIFPPPAEAFEWQDLWKNKDQQASEMLQQGEPARAAETFENESWQASSHYRAGNLEQALEHWQQREDPEAIYNSGNALAGLGQYEEALKAFDKVLESDPNHQDARHNKEIIEQLMQQQQSEDSQGEDEQQSNSDQQGEEQQEQQSQGSGENDQSGQNQQDPADAETEQNESASAGSEMSQEQLSEQAEQDLAQLEEQMSDQAMEQWLRKIPDDPGGLLKRKFLYQYRSRGGAVSEDETW